MSYALQLIVSGLVIGAIYGLMAMAFAVIYKATGLVNFAQGEVGMLVAYVAWWFGTTFDAGVPGIALAAVVAGVAVGLLIERLVMRPMLGEPVFSAVLVTVGLAVILRSLVLLIWGASPHKVEVGAADAVLRLGGFGIRASQIGVIVMLLLAIAAMWLFFQKSRSGVAMRAVASDEKTARLMPSTARAGRGLGRVVILAIAGLFFAVIYNLSPLAVIGLRLRPRWGGPVAVIARPGGLIIGVVKSRWVATCVHAEGSVASY